jgi:exopolyphosphatase/guanosine-5'-triphosphate,3'-diphosphate pyrophosphatase
LLAVAGTAVTVGALVAGVSSSDVMHVDGMHVPRPQLAQVIEHLAWIPAARRLEHPAMVSGREDVIVAGAILLHRVLTRFRFTALQVRVADLLDGVALRAAEDRWPPDGDRPTTADHGMVEQRESHDDAR